MLRSLHFLLLTLLLVITAKALKRLPLVNEKSFADQNSPFTAMMDTQSLKTSSYLVAPSFDGKYTYPMNVALYSNVTVLLGCKGYIGYSCSNFSQECTDHPNILQVVEFPYFTSVLAHQMQIRLTLDDDFGSKFMNVTYVKSCLGTPGKGNSYGYLGFGVGKNNNNFPGLDGTFSVFLSDDGTSGELIFGEDSFKEDTSYRNTIPAAFGWQFPVVEVNVGNDPPVPINATFFGIFDMNLPYIGVPLLTYKSIMNSLSNKGLDCSSTTGNLTDYTCEYTGDISNLPTIHITVNPSLDPIEIPPDVYLQATSNNNIYKLLLVGTSPLPSNALYVTPVYALSIILGQPYMIKYYCIFDYSFQDMTSVNVIRIYKANQGLLNSMLAVVIVILFAMALVGFAISGIYKYRDKLKKKRDEENIKRTIDEINRNINSSIYSSSNSQYKPPLNPYSVNRDDEASVVYS